MANASIIDRLEHSTQPINEQDLLITVDNGEAWAADVTISAQAENTFYWESDGQPFGHTEYSVSLTIAGTRGGADLLKLEVWCQPDIDEGLEVVGLDTPDSIDALGWVSWLRNDDDIRGLIYRAIQGAVAREILNSLEDGEGQLTTDNQNTPIFVYKGQKYRLFWI